MMHKHSGVLFLHDRALSQVTAKSLAAVRMLTCVVCRCPSSWFMSSVGWCSSWPMGSWWVRVCLPNPPSLSEYPRELKESNPLSLQGAYAGFVYTYGVAEPISLPHKTAGYLASIFWAAITAGRLLSIPLSYRFQPVKLLMFNLVRAACATTLHTYGATSN